MAKREKQPLKFHFINPNTDEQTAEFLTKLLPEIIYHNEFENRTIAPKPPKQKKKSCDMER